MDGRESGWTLRHVSALDGLRGLAVAAVLLFHGDHLKGGFLGVDLFFVLSGFLITSLLLAEAGRRDRIDLGRFWSRRARRLLPALALLLLGVAVYAVMLAGVDELARIRADGLATLFYVANWHSVFATQSYWDLFTRPSPLAHTWSLAIEEQFYVVWPLLVTGVVLWRRRRSHRDAAPAIFITSIALATASTIAMALLYRADDTNRAYFGTDTRASSILVGAALAAFLAWKGAPRSEPVLQWLRRAGWAGLAVLAFAWTQLDGTSPAVYRGGFLVCALAAIAIIATVTSPRPGAAALVLELKPLVALGIISYGVYLWHWPVFVTLDANRAHLTGWPLFGVQVAITLAIATASYVFVEHPIRRGAITALTWRRLAPALAAIVVLALVVSTTASDRGPTLADRKPDLPAVALAAAAAAPRSAQRLMIVGNSVADLLADGFKALTTDPPLVVFNGAVASCIFPPGVARIRNSVGHVPPGPVIDCATYWDKDVHEFRPDLVVLVLGDFGDGAYERDGHWIEPCTPEFDDWYRAQLQSAVTTLGSTGARVVLTTAAYAYGVYSASRFPKDDCVNDIHRAVAQTSPNTTLVDLGSFVCPTRDSCKTELDGVELRPDGVHYIGESARLIADWIVSRIRAG